MIYPLVRELAAEKIPVAVTCRVLGFSKQAFYAWCKNPVSRRDWDDAHLINAAYDIHATIPPSATGSSPTSCANAGCRWARTGSPGCARSSGSGRSSPRSAD
jgi:hypothetical protein